MGHSIVSLTLRDLLDHKVGKAKDFAESLVQLSSFKDETERSKAVAAAQALLSHAEDAGWSTFWPVMQRDVKFGKAVVTAIAHGSDRFAASVAQKLTEEHIADLYIWLERNYPHAEDPHYEGVHSVDSRESIAHWRDALLQHLKIRGTDETTKAMHRIVQEFPELHWLRWALLETRDLTRRGTWIPPRPSDIIKLVSSQQASFESPQRTRNSIFTILLSAFVGLALSITVGLIIGWIQQDVLHGVFTSVGLAMIFLFTLASILAGVLLQNRAETKRQG